MNEARKLESWPTQAESLKRIGEIVTVVNVDTGEEILTGKVVGYTDLLGSGGILQPDPERWFDHVTAAIRFPQNPTQYAREMARYRFRIN